MSAEGARAIDMDREPASKTAGTPPQSGAGAGPKIPPPDNESTPAPKHPSKARRSWQSPALLLMGAAFLLATAVAAVLTPSPQSLLLLVGLTVVGVIAIFASSAGLVEAIAEGRRAGLAKRGLEALGDEGWLVLGRSGERLYANRGYRRLLGTSAAGSLIAPGDRLLGGNEARSSFDRMLRSARGGMPARGRFVFRGKGDMARQADVDARLMPGVGASVLVRFREVGLAGEAAVSVTADAPAPAASNDALGFLADAPFGYALVARDGRVEATNAAFEKLAGGVVGKGASLKHWLLEDDVPKLAALLSGATGEPAELRFQGDRERAAHVYPTQFGASEGEPDTEAPVLLFFVETTERKALEAQFSQSQKMQAVGQLAGGVAHDFNNVLTAILGYCDLLLQRHPAGDPSFSDIQQIRQNATRAANLTGQLLAFSRQQTLQPRVLDLTDVVGELTHLLRRLLGEPVELRVRLAKELWAVKVDKVQFEQVLMNLAVNARDAMTDGGRLTVRTANVSAAEAAALGHSVMPAADYVLIEVSDTGCGISKENLNKIFEPFFTTKPVGEGTGLGLSTVYGIVKQTGGFIFPDSEIGEGTVFRIYLPRHAEAPGVAETAVSAKAEPQTEPDLTGSARILIVEDEDAVRTFAARALESRGYEVLSASNGEEALDILEDAEEEFDLLVSDVIMPAMDGPTLVRKAKEDHPAMRVIFMSGYAESEFRESLEERRDFGFLAKPFSLKDLASAVKTALSD